MQFNDPAEEEDDKDSKEDDAECEGEVESVLPLLILPLKLK